MFVRWGGHVYVWEERSLQWRLNFSLRNCSESPEQQMSLAMWKSLTTPLLPTVIKGIEIKSDYYSPFALPIVKGKPQQLGAFRNFAVTQTKPAISWRQLRCTNVSRWSRKITQTYYYPCGQSLVPHTWCEPIWCAIYRHRLTRHFLPWGKWKVIFEEQRL